MIATRLGEQVSGSLKQYEQISAYLDGELSEKERAEVERLLERDAEARRILAELRQTARLLGSLPKERLSAGAAEALNARMERESLFGDGTTRSTGGAWWKTLALAACIVVACLVGYRGMVNLQEYRERRVFQVADAEGLNETKKGPARDVPAIPSGVVATAVPPKSLIAPLEDDKRTLARTESAMKTVAPVPQSMSNSSASNVPVEDAYTRLGAAAQATDKGEAHAPDYPPTRGRADPLAAKRAAPEQQAITARPVPTTTTSSTPIQPSASMPASSPASRAAIKESGVIKVHFLVSANIHGQIKVSIDGLLAARQTPHIGYCVSDVENAPNQWYRYDEPFVIVDNFSDREISDTFSNYEFRDTPESLYELVQITLEASQGDRRLSLSIDSDYYPATEEFVKALHSRLGLNAGRASTAHATEGRVPVETVCLDIYISSMRGTTSKD